MTAYQIHLSVRDRKPHIHALRIFSTRPDGLPDGVHTGGAWRCPDGTVWKPLDGRPFANADYHCRTQEDKCLEALVGQPLFPENWKVHVANNRRFLVREFADVIGPRAAKLLSYEDLAFVEKGLREMNRTGWHVNDMLSLARDRTSGELFILDLSCASQLTTPESEDWRFSKWVQCCGLDWFAGVRTAAHKVRQEWMLERIDRAFAVVSVYAATTTGYSIDGAEVIPAEHEGVEAWILTKDPLPLETIIGNGLVIGKENVRIKRRQKEPAIGA